MFCWFRRGGGGGLGVAVAVAAASRLEFRSETPNHIDQESGFEEDPERVVHVNGCEGEEGEGS